MTLRSVIFLTNAVFVVGLAAGIWLQHRWPLGRARDELSVQRIAPDRTLAELARIPPARRLVIVCTGQSNAANYGESRRTAGPGVYAYIDGKIFAATDPLPGGDGYGGSIWTRLGAKLALTGAYDAVLFAVVAQGSTSVVEWTPGGRHHPRLASTLSNLSALGLPADFILWQQGEEEGRLPAASGRDYGAALSALVRACHAISPTAVFLPARATFGHDVITNEQIRLAQTLAGTSPGSAPGPDLDTLADAHRRDGVHFNDRGLTAAADLWLAALHPLLQSRLAQSSAR